MYIYIRCIVVIVNQKTILSVIGFSLLIVPNLALADNSTVFSDTELMKLYSGPADMQNAINNGSLQYSQIPPDLQIAVKNTPPSSNNSPDYGLVTEVGLVVIIAVVMINIMAYLFKHHKNDSEDEDDDSEDKPRTKSEDKPKSNTFDPHPMGGKTHD